MNNGWDDFWVQEVLFRVSSVANMFGYKHLDFTFEEPSKDTFLRFVKDGHHLYIPKKIIFETLKVDCDNSHSLLVLFLAVKFKDPSRVLPAEYRYLTSEEKILCQLQGKLIREES